MVQRGMSVVLRRAVAGVVGMALLAVIGVSGCGQKGPLTLPKPPPVAASAASAAAPASSPAS